MGLVLRNIKGSKLTSTEMDNNLLYLESLGGVGGSGSQGPNGFQGSVGPQGPNGFQGSVGPQGSQGDLGTQGDIGPQGTQGSQGDMGIVGDTGPQGDVGYQGETGPQGDVGPQGYTGPQGETFRTVLPNPWDLSNNYTLQVSDGHGLIVDSSNTSVSLFIPTNALESISVGSSVIITEIGSGDITINVTDSNTTTIYALGYTNPNTQTIKVAGIGAVATLLKISTDEWVINGDFSVV